MAPGQRLIRPIVWKIKLTTVGQIDPNFYYAVAFDDQTGDGVGPVAITGQHVGSQRRCRRQFPSGGDLPSQPVPGVITAPTRWTAAHGTASLGIAVFRAAAAPPLTRIEFTLDLDARLGNGNFFLPRNAANSRARPLGLELRHHQRQFCVRRRTTASNPSIRSAPRRPRRRSSIFRSPPPGAAITRTCQRAIIRFDVDPSFTTQSSPEFAPVSRALDVSNLQINIIRDRN